MSTPTPADAFARLCGIIARLRAPDGCPWDREQTHGTLRRHLIEEAYETLEAIESGDREHLREELGDLLLQPILHAQIASEAGDFDIAQVVEGISDKLVRRHPHVFGEVQVSDSSEVLRNWDAIKKQEKADKGQTPESLLDGVTHAGPSLSVALEVSKRAAKAHFEWPDVASVMDKLREELDEIEAELQAGNCERVAEELGDLLFTAVNVARWQKIDPELALRDMVRRFETRFRAMESAARARGLELDKLSPESWDELWQQAKRAAPAAEAAG